MVLKGLWAEIPVSLLSKTRVKRSEHRGLELSKGAATEVLGRVAQQQRVGIVWGPNITARAAPLPMP